jgi:hypothetical protein
MEITSLSTGSIKIKGKQGVFVVNPTGKVSGANGVFVLGNPYVDKSKIDPETVILKGPGEYELAGVKISGIRVDTETAYRLTVDKVTILVGKASSLEKDHSKLSDNSVVVLYADTVADPAFVTALEPKVVLFFGEKAEETIIQLAKENFRKEQKYQTTIDKLPAEMESILLA